MSWSAFALASLLVPPPDVLLVTIDTLRADHVGTYGSKSGATPVLDAFASRGVLIEEAVVQVPQTRPSHTSLFTGLLPFEHGIRDNASAPLKPTIPTLASTLRSAGYSTAAFIAAYPVSRASGLQSGFDTFDDPFGGDADFLAGAGERNERPAREVIDAALAFLSRPSAKPRFVWVHLFEPHYPYEPPAPFDQKFKASPYDGEVATADSELKRLLDRFAALPSHLIVVTSDHGEGLGEHGEDEHHLFVYDTTLRVPLIFEGAGLPKGTRVKGQFRSIDLMPTLLDLVSVSRPKVSGLSRAQSLKTGGTIPDNESYAESLYGSIHFGYAPVRALRAEGFKYIDVPKAELYRVATDKGEATNLALDRAPLGATMQKRLRGIHGEDSMRPVQQAPLDSVAQERLAALGYVASGASSSASGGANVVGPDAKDRVAHYGRYSRGINAALFGRRQGDAAAVLKALQPIATEFSNQYSVVSFLGEAFLDLRRFSEALPYLQKARDLSPSGPTWGRVAEALAGASRLDEALDATLKGLRVSPRSTELIRLRVALLSRTGREAEALQFLLDATKADPQAGALKAELSSFRRNAGDLKAADALSEEAVALSPKVADVWVARGLTLAAMNRSDEARAALGRALLLEKRNADALFFSAALEIQRGNMQAARAFLDSLQEIDPRRPGLREMQGAVQQTSTDQRPKSTATVTSTTGAFRLRLIRVATREAAEKVASRLSSGEDFGTVAREMSVDPSAPRGGDLGLVQPADLAGPLAAAASLKPGGVTSVMASGRGFVILKREP